MAKVKCHHCRGVAKLVGGKVIYPHRPDLFNKNFFLCTPCNAYVGCHGNSCRPLGTPANEKLRKLRQQAHAAFDPMWKGKPWGARKSEYAWLSEALGISLRKTHIGMFDESTCLQVVQLCKEREVVHETP